MASTETTSWLEELALLNPCPDALTWARGYPDLASAWQACERGDWMLWYLERTALDTRATREALTCIAIECVLGIEVRAPIAGWDEWAARYLRGEDHTREAAREAREGAREVAAVWAAVARAAVATVAAEARAAARAAAREVAWAAEA